MKTIEKRHLFGFGVFNANFEQIEQSNVVLILLSYNTQIMPTYYQGISCFQPTKQNALNSLLRLCFINFQQFSLLLFFFFKLVSLFGGKGKRMMANCVVEQFLAREITVSLRNEKNIYHNAGSELRLQRCMASFIIFLFFTIFKPRG